jgi:hypothetical protein
MISIPALILLALLGGCGFLELVQNPRPLQPDRDSDLDYVKKRVTRLTPQLQGVYRQESIVNPQEGTARITLHISDKGFVQKAEVAPLAGNLDQHLLNEFKSIALNWRFAVGRKIVYTFKIRFTRG